MNDWFEVIDLDLATDEPCFAQVEHIEHINNTDDDPVP
jgi:hypothetical protein